MQCASIHDRSVSLGEHKTDYPSFGNHYLDDVAYWAHINDLRPCNGSADGTIAVLNVAGHCLPGLQNITFYTFYAFGNIAAREILMHTAQLGGFEDTNGNNIPDLVSEWDKVINATGAPGTDGIPDNYFRSSNVDDLQERLMATITAILRKAPLVPLSRSWLHRPPVKALSIRPISSRVMWVRMERTSNGQVTRMPCSSTRSATFAKIPFKTECSIISKISSSRADTITTR